MPLLSDGNRVLKAVEHLKALDRDGAVAQLRLELSQGSASGERWRSVAQLASHIGEMHLSHEAARRYAVTQPMTLERVLSYCRELIRDGRTEVALGAVDGLPEPARLHSSVLHLRGTIASQTGDFEAAESFFRQALDQTPLAPQSWFALGVIKTFRDGDPDIAQMERLKPDMLKGEARFAAQFCYALGKAYDDIGDPDRAYAVYNEGAAIMRQHEPYSAKAGDDFADTLIREYALGKFDLLIPSGCDSNRVIFVNGTPRSGTTLVEQILTSHSQVSDGAELNLLKAALIPAGDLTLLGALNYQTRQPPKADPWGNIADTYLRMIEDRFGSAGRVVDKTLNQSRMMGLLLHMLPKARIVWLRRNPADTALSCFRTFFTAPVPWSWSVSDIASFLRTEDRLHAHWTALFPDRILTVPYEELTSNPQTWIGRIMSHVGLDHEPQVFEPHKSERSVMTASVAQVRKPISSDRVGAAGVYKQFQADFQHAYRTE